MRLLVEQECPQCGGAVEIDEADTLLSCPYCDVRLFRTTAIPRFVLPHEIPIDQDLVYVPYLRCKGSLFSCYMPGLDFRVVDMTSLGVPLNVLPVTLGFRPQAMKMKPASPDRPGTFLRCSLKMQDALNKVENHPAYAKEEQLLHRVFIGETLSLIYLPLLLDHGKVLDGVTAKLLARLPSDSNIFDRIVEKDTGWKTDYIATLCPECGWGLDGERNSVALTCAHCHSVWAPAKKSYSRVACWAVHSTNESSRYLPFWRITAATSGVRIDSLADFFRVTNQPRMPRKDWESRKMDYWIPAFKLQPKMFLRTASRLSLFLLDYSINEELPNKHLFPLSLPRSEAVQSLKIVLAESVCSKKEFMPRLPEVSFSIQDIRLIYLPFKEGPRELEQEHTGLSIDRQALDIGSKL